MWWVVPLIIGAVLWSAADTISDAVITDHTAAPKDDHSEEEGGIQGINANFITYTYLNVTSLCNYYYYFEKAYFYVEKEKEMKMSGEQDAAVSMAVMAVLAIVLHGLFTKEHVMDLSNEVVWLALLAGAFQCVSLVYLLKSFENSSSTIIIPLMQLNAVLVLPLSIVLTLLSGRFTFLASHHTFIRPLHLLAFVLIFFGGFYPACDGNFSKFTTSAFWKQRAVVHMLISDTLIALYYILVTACTSESAGMSNWAFLIVTLWGNTICFAAMCIFIPHYRNQIMSMGNVTSKFVVLSCLGEIFSLSGYFAISFSYALYYNSGVVSAAEGALNQLFNLILAIVFKKYPDIFFFLLLLLFLIFIYIYILFLCTKVT
eukprot:Phypoly_transcript_08132.p1 GENE.Phypoly_transcript_08132~~Phypoly_transcript_08132.p1  ORF type:complete len:372 (+),score=18.63 Phypoly_transcript_08132:303-1418(+)